MAELPVGTCSKCHRTKSLFVDGKCGACDDFWKPDGQNHNRSVALLDRLARPEVEPSNGVDLVEFVSRQRTEAEYLTAMRRWNGRPGFGPRGEEAFLEAVEFALRMKGG